MIRLNRTTLGYRRGNRGAAHLTAQRRAEAFSAGEQPAVAFNGIELLEDTIVTRLLLAEDSIPGLPVPPPSRARKISPARQVAPSLDPGSTVFCPPAKREKPPPTPAAASRWQTRAGTAGPRRPALRRDRNSADDYRRALRRPAAVLCFQPPHDTAFRSDRQGVCSELFSRGCSRDSLPELPISALSCLSLPRPGRRRSCRARWKFSLLQWRQMSVGRS